MPFFFHSGKPFLAIAIRKKIKFDKSRCLFSTTLRLQGDHYCACAQKWCHFSYFPRPFKLKKKTKKLRPKMTRITSRGSCLNFVLFLWQEIKFPTKMSALTVHSQECRKDCLRSSVLVSLNVNITKILLCIRYFCLQDKPEAEHSDILVQTVIDPFQLPSAWHVLFDEPLSVNPVSQLKLVTLW